MNSIKFFDVRDKVLRGENVEGCRKNATQERNEGNSFSYVDYLRIGTGHQTKLSQRLPHIKIDRNWF